MALRSPAPKTSSGVAAEALTLRGMTWDITLLRLVVAAACGGILGLHTGLRDRPGGVRTHVMTALGAALFASTGLAIAPGDGDAAMRAVQGVATGVGFIGGSVVLREGNQVKGVATGASLWIAAALGCAVAFGHFKVAIAVAAFIALINVATFYLERLILSKSPLSEHDVNGQPK